MNEYPRVILFTLPRACLYIISHLNNGSRAMHLHRVAAMQFYFNISIHVRRKFQKATAIRLNEQSL